MKNLLALLGLAIVAVGGIGWYQGWYKLSVSRNTDGTLRVQTDVNTTRMGEDISQIGRKVEGFAEQKLDQPGTPASTHGPVTTPTPTPPTGTPKPATDTLKEGAGWLLGNVLGNAKQN